MNLLQPLEKRELLADFGAGASFLFQGGDPSFRQSLQIQFTEPFVGEPTLEDLRLFDRASGSALGIPLALHANASTINLGGMFNATGGIGTFNNVNGAINVTGTINNAGNTITLSNTFNSATGSWHMRAGTISGGNMTFLDGTMLIMTGDSGTLSNVAINGDLALPANAARVVITGATSFTTAHMSGNGTSIAFAPGGILAGAIQFEGADPGSRHVEMNATGTLTVGPAGAIRSVPGFLGSANVGSSFWFSGVMTLVNNGTISAGANGRTVTIFPSAFTNAGTVEAKNNGTMLLRSANNGGILSGGSWKVSSAGSLVIQPPTDADTALRASVNALIKSGRNGGTWDGPGIGSTALPGNQAVGVKLDTLTSPDSILVRHTLMGDLNLDRSVTISDFIDLASNFNKTGAGWWEGDINYDDNVTISDFIDLAANFNTSLPLPPASTTAQAAAGSESATRDDTMSAEVLSTQSARSPLAKKADRVVSRPRPARARIIGVSCCFAGPGRVGTAHLLIVEHGALPLSSLLPAMRTSRVAAITEPPGSTAPPPYAVFCELPLLLIFPHLTLCSAK